jgi:hypothetical protein
MPLNRYMRLGGMRLRHEADRATAAGDPVLGDRGWESMIQARRGVLGLERPMWIG